MTSRRFEACDAPRSWPTSRSTRYGEQDQHAQRTLPQRTHQGSERLSARRRSPRACAEEITGAIVEDDQQLVKFHGMYLQDDRDLRAERGRKKMEKAFSFMIRACAFPAAC